MTLVEDEVQLPTGDRILYLRQPPGAAAAVGIVALSDAGQLLIQREYSYPPDEVLWQLPGGGIEPGEDVDTAARRELSEESGFTAGRVDVIGAIYLDNRRSDALLHVAVCTDLQPRQLPADQAEFIDSSWLAVDEVHALIRDGQVRNITMLAALNLWFHVATP
jgi:ADP-ribose pyrophosphatase